MTNKLMIAAAATVLLLFNWPAITAENEVAKPASNAQARADMQVLVMKVQNKLKEGKKSESDLADELKEFDTLLDKYKDQKTEDVAQILLMKAMLYFQIIKDVDKGTALVEQLKRDFPDTSKAKRADEMMAAMKRQTEAEKDQKERQAAAEKIQNGLSVGSKFPDFEEQDLDGKPLSVANYKGKVVLVDFWATWCGPCVRELPNVLQAYEKFHPKGFEIVGISLDSDKSRLTAFIEKQKMPWRQYFDGKMWGNKLAGKYGVNSIPATYLLDGEGTIIAKNLRGEELDTEVAKALEKH